MIFLEMFASWCYTFLFDKIYQHFNIKSLSGVNIKKNKTYPHLNFY